MYQEGQTATHKDGRRIIYQGGEWRLLKDQAPAGGVPNALTGAPSPKLTEDQGKSQTYTRLMATAERQYDNALRDGYDYGDPINAIARGLETPAPVVGAPLAGLAPILRGKAADQAVAAERAWLDAQMKAMTGAGQNAQEAAESPRTYFPQFGESPEVMGNKRQMRETAFEAAKTRSAAGAADVAYPQQLPQAARATFERLHSAGQIDTNQPHGSRANPFVARDEATANALPPGSFVVMPNGRLGVVE
jgi:hypothetical protein